MAGLLPPKTTPEITFLKGPFAAKAWATHDLVLIVAAANNQESLLKQCQRSPELLRQYHRLLPETSAPLLRLAPNEHSAGILLSFVKPGLSSFERLQIAAKLWKEAASQQPGRIALGTLGLAPSDVTGWRNDLLAAVLAGSAPLPSYKRKPTTTSLQSISVEGSSDIGSVHTVATHAGNHLARWLTTLPPNELTTGRYRTALLQLAKREGWQTKFLDTAALKQQGAGAFLAVARANAHDDAGILQLRYRAKRKPSDKKGKPLLSLVGKGICFDTGGINLKPHRSMYDMHTDMQGSAVAVGTLLALSTLKVPFDIDCWLALTENEIGPNAYRPQEVITAANGTTIQVVHSDAEGRMALADTLTLAARAAPAMLIDFATLTGACVGALTERMSGAFSNRAELREGIESAGQHSGERIWSFPMDADFDSDLDSPIADILQCTLDSKGDHILAARFLNRFVPETVPWVHIDLSSSTRAGGLAHIPTDITGFGVRWAVEFVTRQFS